jgi:hypothetical protein
MCFFIGQGLVHLVSFDVASGDAYVLLAGQIRLRPEIGAACILCLLSTLKACCWFSPCLLSTLKACFICWFSPCRHDWGQQAVESL